jgi:hypothetical protein
VATGAVAAGRLDAAAVQIGLPPLLLAAVRLLLRGPSVTGWRSAWAVGLGLSLLVAFAPACGRSWRSCCWAAARRPSRRRHRPGRARRPQGLRRLLAAVVVCAVPLLVLLPWSLSAGALHGLLQHGPGPLAPGLTAAALPAWDLLLLSPGGPARRCAG